eukprot:1050496-Rhodomonas_salina.1
MALSLTLQVAGPSIAESKTRNRTGRAGIPQAGPSPRRAEFDSEFTGTGKLSRSRSRSLLLPSPSQAFLRFNFGCSVSAGPGASAPGRAQPQASSQELPLLLVHSEIKYKKPHSGKFLVQFVLKMRFLVFEFGVYGSVDDSLVSMTDT